MGEAKFMIHQVEKNLGRFLFPHSEPWQQKRKTRTFLWVLITELLVTAIVVFLVMYHNGQWS
jgi:hypothetical protein